MEKIKQKRNGAVGFAKKVTGKTYGNSAYYLREDPAFRNLITKYHNQLLAFEETLVAEAQSELANYYKDYLQEIQKIKKKIGVDKYLPDKLKKELAIVV